MRLVDQGGLPHLRSSARLKGYLPYRHMPDQLPSDGRGAGHGPVRAQAGFKLIANKKSPSTQAAAISTSPLAASDRAPQVATTSSLCDSIA